MGDNREHSVDSREFGVVATDEIIGRAWLRFWPLDSLGLLQVPTYPDLPPSDRPPSPLSSAAASAGHGRRARRDGSAAPPRNAADGSDYRTSVLLCPARK